MALNLKVELKALESTKYVPIAIKTTSILTNYILYQFGGLHKLWEAPLIRLSKLISSPS